MTNKLTTALLCAIFGTVLMFSTCDTDILQKPATAPGTDGAATVTITIRNSPEPAETASRSVLPQYSAADVDHYELRGGKVGEAETVLLSSFTGAATVTLAAGTWNFTVNAYNDKGAVFLQGNVQNKVISASSGTLSFYLLPLNSGQGSIHITVNFPAGSDITTASVTTGGGSPETAVVSGTSAVYEKSPVNAGDYFVSVALEDSDGTVRAVVSELVVVRGGVTSEKTVALTAAELKVVSYAVPDGGEIIYISTKTQLAAINNDITNAAKNYGKNAYVLTADIDVSGETWTPIGSSSSFDQYGNIPTGTLKPFSGNFYGDNHTIRGLKLPGGTIPQIGLFGYAVDAMIRDLQVELATNTSISLSNGSKGVGIIMGFGEGNTRITNCGVYSNGTFTVSGSSIYDIRIGGIAGVCPTVANCYAAINMNGTNTGTHITIGGITAGGTAVRNSYFAGIITATCGYIWMRGISCANVSYCYSAGSITSNNSGAAYSATGGIVSWSGTSRTVSNSAVLLSSISHTNNTNYARIQRDVNSDVADLTNNYAFSGMLLNGSTVSDAVSNPQNSQNGLGKTAAQLKQRSTYETGLGWDFADVWEMGPPEYPYPILKWQKGVVHVPDGFTVIRDVP